MRRGAFSICSSKKSVSVKAIISTPTSTAVGVTNQKWISASSGMRKAPPTETRAAPERTAPSSSSSSISSSIALRTFLGAGTGGGSPVGRRLSSSAVSAAETPSKRAKGRPPNQMSQRTSGSRTTAVAMRTARLRLSSLMSRGGPHLRGGLAEAALAALEVVQGDEEVELAEVGPQGLGPADLRVSELPEEEIGDAHVAAGASHQLQGRQARGPEPLLDGLGVDLRRLEPILGDAASHGDDLLAAAVAERARQDHLVVLRAVEPQLLQRIAHPRGQPVQLADGVQADAGVHDLGPPALQVGAAQ